MKKDKEIEFHLPYPLFDSHFHALHMEEKGFQVDSLIPALLSSGLSGAVEVAVNELDFEKRLELAEAVKGLYLSAGIHPSSTIVENGVWEERFAKIISQAQHPLVRAIGETGLDFFRDYAPRELQEKAFRCHLDLAADTGLPVIIHNRAADDRVLALVEESSCRRGVFHCFSSDRNAADKALALGFHISFAGNITYKNTEKIREAALMTPSEMLLIETDSPYLSPQSVRGRTNHPGHIGYTLEFLADIRGEGAEELAAATVENANQLFRGQQKKIL